MKPQREFVRAEIVILSSDDGGRATPLLPVAYRGQYRPHIVLQSRETRQAKVELREGMRHVVDEYLGVAFWSGPEPIPIGHPFLVSLSLMYPDHPAYVGVSPGAEFTLREGAKIVGHGRVLERWTESAEPDAAPNSRCAGQSPTSPEIRLSDSLRTPSSGGCG
jgi:hypothetical protein